MSAAKYTLEIKDLSKSYGETHALADVNLKLVSGQVTGIIGANGAGKTTLVKMISGEEGYDSGEIYLNKERFVPTEDSSSVSIVHQEVKLFPNLTVADNLMIHLEDEKKGLIRPNVTASIKDIALELGLTEYLNTELQFCSLVVSQLTEIAKALMTKNNAHIFLFDEPNSALSNEESEELFSSMQRIAKQGNIVVFITHRLSELVKIADRVVVVRDGKIAADYQKNKFDEHVLANELTVGYSKDNVGETEVRKEVKKSKIKKESLLSLQAWDTDDEKLKDINISVSSNEIIGLFGVEGSGVRELIQNLDLYIDENGSFSTYLPAERTKSLFRLESIKNNLVIRTEGSNLAKKSGIMKFSYLAEQAKRLVKEFSIRTKDSFLPITSLSGGNQQKVAIASAITKESKILLLEEPTRGVDIASKKDIYEMLRAYVKKGYACVVMCTEFPEIYELVDRCIVVSEGKISGEVQNSDFKNIEDLAKKLTLLSSGTS